MASKKNIKDWHDWSDISKKITEENEKIEKAYKELAKAKTFDEWITVRHEIDRINRHIECLEAYNTTEFRTTNDLQKKKIRVYAIDTTKI